MRVKEPRLRVNVCERFELFDGISGKGIHYKWGERRIMSARERERVDRRE